MLPAGAKVSRVGLDTDGTIVPSQGTHNNPVERALRGVAIGRKNFLFVGNDAGDERAASFYSIIETYKLNGIEPFAYLCDVLEKLPTWPNKRLHELLPWNWKKTALP